MWRFSQFRNKNCQLLNVHSLVERQLSHSLILTIFSSRKPTYIQQAWVSLSLTEIRLMVQILAKEIPLDRELTIFLTEISSIEASFHISNMVFFCKEVWPL